MTKTLYRSCKNSLLGGVAGGIGEYFDLDPTLIRLIWVLLAFSGFGILAYLVAWVIIPPSPDCQTKETATDEIRNKAEGFATKVREAAKSGKKDRENTAFWFGLIFIALGTGLIVENVSGFGFWHIFWPLVIIIIGVSVIAGALEK